MERAYCKFISCLQLHNFNRNSVYLLIILCIISLNNGASFGPDSSTQAPVYPSENTTTIEEPTNMTLQENNEPTFTCRNLTNYAQRSMCYNTPGLLKAVLDAKKLAREECIEQFRYERWNCSGFTMTTPSNITKQATKEAAYMYALMSAALAHVIARECRTNEMDCSCGKNVTLPDDGDTTVEHGCSDNIQFGLKMSAQFMDAKEKHGSIIGNRQRINLQNNLVGRTVFYNVNNKSGIHCKCYGFSASCPLKLCRFKVIPFNAIAAHLKIHYNNSCKVSVKSNGHLQSHCDISPINNETLVHTTSSPDFCHRNLAKGAIGVTGRECNPTGSKEEKCDTVCCGRGHTEQTKTVTGECCSYYFGWICTECVNTQTYYTCR